MRRLFLILVLSITAAAQTTPNLNFNVPVPGTLNWGNGINQNFYSLDSILSGVTSLPGLALPVASNVNGVLNPVACSLTPSTLIPSWCAGSDIGAWTNAAIAQLGCGQIFIPTGNYTQTTTIIKPRCILLRGSSSIGTVLHYTGSSYALIIADTSGATNYPPGAVEDLVLNGTASGQAILVGGDPNGILTSASAQADHQSFNRIKVLNFGAHAIQWGNNGWSNTFFESIITNNGDSQVYFPSGLINSGESLGFVGTRIQNSSGLGVNQVGFSYMWFVNCSFDFNSSGSGNVLALANVVSGHFETQTGTLLTLNSTAFPAQVAITGGHFQQDATSGTDPNMIVVSATNGPVIRVHDVDMIANTGTHSTTTFIHWAGSGGTAQEIVTGVNYQGSGVGELVDNLPCAFFGCQVQDIATGLLNTGYLIHARTVTIDPTYGNVNQFIGPTDQPLQIASQNNQNIALIPNGSGIVKIGSNNAAQIIGSGTAAMTTAAITAGNCGATVTVSATGVATTDTITWAFNAAPSGSNAGIVAWPTANNVNFAYCSNTAQTPAAATINWRVVR